MQQITEFWKSRKGKITILGGGGIVGLLSLCVVCTVCSALIGNEADNETANIEARATNTPTVTPIATQTPIPTNTLEPTNTPLPPTDTPTLEPTPKPTATPIPEIVTSLVTANENAVNIRSGPSTDYETIGTLPAGESLEIVGRNADSSWWQVSTPNGIGWIFAEVVTASDVDDNIPIGEVPPLPTQPPQPTEAPLPTQPPQPTEAPLPTQPPTSGSLVIVAVNKRDEFVDIQNASGQPIDLNGWNLLSEKGNQNCPLGGVIQPGETLRIWALSDDAGQGGYNCGFGSNIWNNSESDPAILYDPNGAEISRK